MKSIYFGRVEEVHCGYCMAPINAWKPMENYKSDKSCQFYNDVIDMASDLEDKQGFITRHTLLVFCGSLKFKYPDIENFEAAVMECFDCFEECGTHVTRK